MGALLAAPPVLGLRAEGEWALSVSYFIRVCLQACESSISFVLTKRCSRSEPRQVVWCEIAWVLILGYPCLSLSRKRGASPIGDATFLMLLGRSWSPTCLGAKGPGRIVHKACKEYDIIPCRCSY